MKHALSPELQRRTGFAMAVHRDAHRRRGYGLELLPKIELEPNGVSIRPDDKYWKSNPDAQERHDIYLKESLRMVGKWKVTHHGGFFSALGHALSSAVHAIEKIPVLGSITKIAEGPFKLTAAIANGQRLDKAMLGTLKEGVNAVRDVAPYAQMVVSVIPGIGTGIGAALGAATALMKGRPITEALMAGVKGALPGGPLAASGFDMAMNLAHGKPVLESVLHAARDQLPGDVAKKAFDIGLALAHGRKLQNAVLDTVTSFAPAEVKGLVEAGSRIVNQVPGMKEAAQLLQHPKQLEGFKFATALLGHSGMNQEYITAVRKQLSPHALTGFDAALHLQKPHMPWLEQVKEIPVPKMRAPVAVPLASIDDELPPGFVPLAVEGYYI